MIKANELRIGNYVKMKDYILCVKAISRTVSLGNSNESDYIHDAFNYTFVNPIALTPEILENCGFVKAYEDGILTFTLVVSNKNIAPSGNNEYKLFGIKGKEDSIQIDYTVNKYWGAKSVHFLHQLQNLYYALTGEELEVSLK